MHIAAYAVVLRLLAAPAAADADIPITDRLHHLGDGPKPAWKDIASVEPLDPKRLEVDFEAARNPSALALEIQAGDVSGDWQVGLNGTVLGKLRRESALTPQFFPIPPGLLRDGKNRLRVETASAGDDIYVGKAAVRTRPLRELLDLIGVTIAVRDAETGEPLPCRLTVTRAGGADGGRGPRLADLLAFSDRDLVVRRGVIYTREGLAAFDLAPGRYEVHATRGFEYGLATAELDLPASSRDRRVELTLRREVDTEGLLAADTHIHTRTFSGHGDISVEERVITIAGEGIEVAIATDHNHATDYRPFMEAGGITGRYLPVIGDEVTTALGHFNAFPFEAGERPPRHDHRDWTRLIQAMRSSRGVRVVILNHPRRPLDRLAPLEMVGLDPLSGESHSGPDDLGLDAIEIINGKTLTSDPMTTIRDWFALLNRGFPVKAVAGSDSHAVVDEIVGQARTYVASAEDDPRKLRIDDLCDAFLAGRLHVSLGLLARVVVEGEHGPGDLATVDEDGLDVAIRVEGPSWTRADTVALYLNGIEARRERIAPTARPLKFGATWKVPHPGHDVHLVVVAIGPPVTDPWWPTSGGASRYVLAATNPVWIDADGDGKFTSARGYAEALVRRHGAGSEALGQALGAWDAAVAVQAASIARARIQAEVQAAYDRLLEEADAKVADLLGPEGSMTGRAISEYFSAAPPIEVRTRREREEEAARLRKEEPGAGRPASDLPHP